MAQNADIMKNPPVLSSTTATIAASGSLSGSINLRGGCVVGYELPVGFEGTSAVQMALLLRRFMIAPVMRLHMLWRQIDQCRLSLPSCFAHNF